MRLVVWNCAGAVRKKWSSIEGLQPDVAVIIECDQPARIANLGFDSSAWVGRIPHKGLAVFGFGDWKVLDADFVEDRLEYVLPVHISGPAEFDLYGVWASNRRASVQLPGHEHLPQPHALMDVYQPSRSPRPAIIAGDFNNSAYWDKPRRSRFADMAKRYEQEGFHSLYHHQTGEEFAAEASPTHWWRDRREDGHASTSTTSSCLSHWRTARRSESPGSRNR